MSETRKPAAFKLSPDVAEKPVNQQSKPVQHRRAPVARPMAEIIEEPDVFADTGLVEIVTLPAPVTLSRWTVGKVFGTAAGLLVSLAIGLWVDTLVRDMFSRADWLGYTAISLVGVAVLALLVIVAREMAGLSRLNAASRLREYCGNKRESAWSSRSPAHSAGSISSW